MTDTFISSCTIGYCLPGSTRPDYSRRSSKRSRSHRSSSYSPVATGHRTAAAADTVVDRYLDCTIDCRSSTAAAAGHHLHNTAASRIAATTAEKHRIRLLLCLEGYTPLPDSQLQLHHPASCQYFAWPCPS